MSKLPGKLGPHVHPDVRVNATTLVLKKPIKKMDCIAQIVNFGKLCVNFLQRIRMDSLQCTIGSALYSTQILTYVLKYI